MSERGGWQTIECERVLYVHRGKTVVLCDRLPSPVTLVVKLCTQGRAALQRKEGEPK